MNKLLLNSTPSGLHGPLASFRLDWWALAERTHLDHASFSLLHRTVAVTNNPSIPFRSPTHLFIRRKHIPCLWCLGFHSSTIFIVARVFKMSTTFSHTGFVFRRLAKKAGSLSSRSYYMHSPEPFHPIPDKQPVWMSAEEAVSVITSGR